MGHLKLRSPGKLLLTAIVEVKNEGAPGTNATVTLAVSTDSQTEAERVADERSVEIAGGQKAQVPLQGLVVLPPGRHSVGFGADPSYSKSGLSGDLVVSRVSIIATGFPSAGVR